MSVRRPDPSHIPTMGGSPWSCIVVLLLAQAAFAQTTLIRNATVHTLAGEPIEEGSVLIEGGKIAGVGRGLRAPKGATIIDAKGKHLYPGMFDAFTQVGLVEITAVGVTVTAPRRAISTHSSRPRSPSTPRASTSP